MPRRRQNPRLAKSLRCYTIPEASELYDVHRNTVRHWLANGLATIDNGRPILIHGEELNRFHKERREASKVVCGLAELYCLRCRRPKRPAGDIADYVPVTDKVGTLSAICPDCQGMMSQRINEERLQRFSAEIDIKNRPVAEALEESR